MILNDPSAWRSTPEYREITPPHPIDQGAWKGYPNYIWPLLAIMGYGMCAFVVWLILYAVRHA